jgi:hypothetical protein
MSDIRKMLERFVDGYAPDPEPALAATLRLVSRRDRRRRVAVAALALALFAATAVVLGLAFSYRGKTTPASSPSLAPTVRPATPVAMPAAAPASGAVFVCAASAPGDPRCAPQGTYRVGDVVELHGGRRERSLPRGTKGEIWWRAPRDDGWRRVDVVAADGHGQILWTWRSAESGAQEGTHSFQLRVASMGASRILQVELLPPTEKPR